MRGSAKVVHVGDCGLDVYHSPSLRPSLFVPVWQRNSLIAIFIDASICGGDFFNWAMQWLEKRSGCSSPLRAYLHSAALGKCPLRLVFLLFVLLRSVCMGWYSSTVIVVTTIG